MKALRLFTFMLLTVLILSALGTAPVHAKTASTATDGAVTLTIDLAKDKLAKLRVNNRTGGTLFIRLSGERSYNFSTSKQGKTTFDAVIQPGKYTVTVTASACSGQLTFKKKVNGGTLSVRSVYCRK